MLSAIPAAAGIADRLHGAPDIGPDYTLFRCLDAAEADRVEHSLRESGVDFRLWYGRGLQHQTCYAGLAQDALDVTEVLACCLFGLPMAPDLEGERLSRVVTAPAARAVALS
jgi:hypothetical protein